MKNKKVKDKFERFCVVCGKKFTVTRYSDNTYDGGYYFGDININSSKTSKYFYDLKGKKIKNKDYNSKAKKVMVEYWECDKCFNEVLKNEKKNKI